MTQSDEAETVERNPKSWIAWKRVAENAQDDNEDLREYARFLESRNWWQRLLNIGVQS